MHAATLISMSLIPSKLEIAFQVAFSPRARDGAVVRADLVQLPIDDDGLVVFAFGFQVHGPIIGIQSGALYRNTLGAGINGALDRGRVPFHEYEDGNFLARCRLPFAVPGAGQRMPFLPPKGA